MDTSARRQGYDGIYAEHRELFEPANRLIDRAFSAPFAKEPP